MIWSNRSKRAAGEMPWWCYLPPLASIALGLALAGCQPGLTVIDADAPVRLAEPTRAKVYVDMGAKATPGHPHVEDWELQPNAVELPAGKYVITRRPATAPAH